MHEVLITGGSGFFGELLKWSLLEQGVACTNVDLEPETTSHPNLSYHSVDIRDRSALDAVFQGRRFECIFHCAAQLSHAAKYPRLVWSCNVDGTKNVAECAKQYGVPKVVFVSTNCLWAESFDKPVTEDEPPRPREIYGKSKLEGERILQSYGDTFDSVIIRTSTIIGRGRLGLLTILFEFIDEGRRIWVVGGGRNKIQFVDADDLVAACIKAMSYAGSGTFNVGSDDVNPIRSVYEFVINKAGSKSRIASLPRFPTLSLMRLAYSLRLSPLGPYQYLAIAESFQFDTSRAKNDLGWTPTTTNENALWKAYEYYRDHRGEISQRENVSVHKRPAKLGLIRLVKWLS